MSFNYTKFLKEGGIEKNLQEAGDFGNDPQDRYNYVRKFTADLPDTARTEQMIDNLDDALEDYKMTDEVGEFDQAFVEIMIALGKESELMEGESLINPEAEEISPEDLEAASDLLATLAENDDVLDEMLDEAPMVVDDFEVGDRVALNVAYQEAGGKERMIPSEFKFTVVGVREVPKGGGGTYQDVSVERYENGKPVRKSYDNAQLARIEDQEMFGEMIEEGGVVATFNVGDYAKLIVDPKLGVDQPGERLEVIRVEPQIGGKFFNVQVQNSKGKKAEYDNKQLALVGMGPISRREEDEGGGYQLGELEGEVQNEEKEEK